MAKATIGDVAKLAKVSISTVSNVLNGRAARMRPETQERILNAIKELGYSPNQAARQLKTGHSPFLGLIVPSVANPYFGVFARLVEDAALEKGYQVLLCNSDRDPTREKKYAEALWGYGVKGLILGSSLEKFDYLEDLLRKGMQAVAFDRLSQDSDAIAIDSVGVDNVQTTRLLTKHLLSLGHTRIAFASGPISTVSRLNRLKGYRMSLEEANIELAPELVWEASTANYGDAATVDLGRQAAHDLLSRATPPTAILCINDMYAFGVYAGARDLGLSIPDDLSVTGIDDIELAEVVEPPLTTVRQPIRDIARMAVERLVGRLRGDVDETPIHQTMSPKLIVRASTARNKTP